MKIKCEEQGHLGACCYMVQSEKAALIIDPFKLTFSVKEFIDDNREKEIYILATHRHFDHVAGIPAVKDYGGGKTVISAADECGLLSTADSMGERFHISYPTAPADILVNDGDILRAGELEIKVLCTPGHTVGSVCFIIDDVIFSGDTLFRLSVGRTDFPTGDFAAMQHSLQKLFSLDGDYTVYPGHGESTTLRFEEQNNPYYRNY